MKHHVALSLGALLAATGWAQSEPPPSTAPAASPESVTAAPLPASERIRPEVESIVAELNRPSDRSAGLFQRATSRLVALGPEVVPFMIAELDYPTATTFHVAGYVLGTLGGPEAVQALRKAVERSEGYHTKFGEGQKAYAIVGLALAGERDALRLVETGAWAGSFPMLEDTSLVELLGLLTAPDSVPILLEWLALDPAAEGNPQRLRYALRALGRIADPAAAERIVPLLENGSWELRRETLAALGGLGSPATADVLLAALDDPTVEVTYAAAMALEASSPASKIPAIQARLVTEPNTEVRRLLYRALAASGGTSQIATLAKHWGRDDPLDRLEIVRSVAVFEDPKGFDVLRNALDDPNGIVVLTACEGLGALGTSEARKALLAQLAKPDWDMASRAVPALVALDERKAAPAIAHQLLEVELTAPISDPLRSDDIAALGDALVALSYTEALPALLEAAPSQSNPTIVAELQSLSRRLSAIEARGNDVTAWSEALRSSDDWLRLLAIDRLARAGGSATIEALSAAFEGAAETERLAILDALGRTGSPKALPLLERVLMDAEFDAYAARRLRSTAAWSVRRIGGKQAVDLLRRSVHRREGLDMDVLVYLAVLEGREAIPDLERYRISRLRDLWWQRGLEQSRINVMLYALAEGRTLAFLDRSPSTIHLGPWE